MSQAFPGLIEQYAQGVDQLKQAIAGMTPEQVAARPIPGKWSTLEVIAHLADFEPIFAERMKRIISHDRPLLMIADENLFEAELAYPERDLAEEMAIIESTRKQMVRILKKIPAEYSLKSGVHSQKGLISLEAALLSAVNHIPHHVKFIYDKRKALGI